MTFVTVLDRAAISMIEDLRPELAGALSAIWLGMDLTEIAAIRAEVDILTWRRLHELRGAGIIDCDLSRRGVVGALGLTARGRLLVRRHRLREARKAEAA